MRYGCDRKNTLFFRSLRIFNKICETVYVIPKCRYSFDKRVLVEHENTFVLNIVHFIQTQGKKNQRYGCDKISLWM